MFGKNKNMDYSQVNLDDFSDDSSDDGGQDFVQRSIQNQKVCRSFCNLSLAFTFFFQLDFIVNDFVAVGTYEKTR